MDAGKSYCALHVLKQLLVHPGWNVDSGAYTAMKHRSAETRWCATRYNILAMFTRKYGFPNVLKYCFLRENLCFNSSPCWNWNFRKFGWICLEGAKDLENLLSLDEGISNGRPFFFQTRDYPRVIERKSIMRITKRFLVFWLHTLP